MASANASALLEALFIYGNTDKFDLDKRTKAALRLCNKHLKNLVDATVTAARTCSNDLYATLNALSNTEWHGLKNLVISEDDYRNENRITELPSALFIKFSRLETLKIERCTALESLPTEIGELRHLKVLVMHSCHSIKVLPSSLGQLATLKNINMHECRQLTAAGLAPLQHFTGLTSLALSCYSGKMMKCPDFICNLTTLKALHLYFTSVNTLPAALGNLTNLEKLTISLRQIKELPESIGNLHALKEIDLNSCTNLTALPESLDDLLWRKAHEKGRSMERVSFCNCPKLAISPKMNQAFDLLRHKGTSIRLITRYPS